MRGVIRWTGLSLAVALASCESSGTGPNDAPDPELDRDVAVQVGEAAAQDIEMMGSPGGTLGINAAAARDRHWPFRCGRIEFQNFLLERSCVFRDVDDEIQDEYDAETTESATIHFELAASISRPHWSAEVERIRDLVISGLLGDEETRTWNGEGSHAASRVRHKNEEVTREYSSSGSWAIDDVIVPAPASDDNWPLSGTISSDLTVNVVGGPRDGTTRNRTATVTFNGTRLVPIVVNGTTFTFDLRSRRIVDDEDVDE